MKIALKLPIQNTDDPRHPHACLNRRAFQEVVVPLFAPVRLANLRGHPLWTFTEGTRIDEDGRPTEL